jgi:hypothetical protein
MKKMNFIACLMLFVLFAVCVTQTSCIENAVDEKDIQGTIVGYHKCNDHDNNNELVFGIYIVTEKRNSILAYNIPHSKLNSLLALNIYDLEQGSLYFGKEIAPITFTYREAKADEIVIIECPQLMMNATFNGEDFKQVIITNLNNEKIK